MQATGRAALPTLAGCSDASRFIQYASPNSALSPGMISSVQRPADTDALVLIDAYSIWAVGRFIEAII